MSYKRLFVWVEGPDDERFFKGIIVPKLQKKYREVKIVLYANMKKEKINDFIKGIKAMNADYIFVTDINDSPCVTARKQKKQEKVEQLDETNIVVAVKEIESWYLAGMDDDCCRRFRIRVFKKTNHITKEKFNDLIPTKFDSRTDFMLEILKFFSVRVGISKNDSFKYLVEKYGIECN